MAFNGKGIWPGTYYILCISHGTLTNGILCSIAIKNAPRYTVLRIEIGKLW